MDYVLRQEDHDTLIQQPDRTRGHILFQSIDETLVSTAVHPVKIAASLLENLGEQDIPLLQKTTAGKAKTVPYHKRAEPELASDFCDSADLFIGTLGFINTFLILSNNQPHLYQFRNKDGVISYNELPITIKPRESETPIEITDRYHQ